MPRTLQTAQSCAQRRADRGGRAQTHAGSSGRCVEPAWDAAADMARYRQLQRVSAGNLGNAVGAVRGKTSCWVRLGRE